MTPDQWIQAGSAAASLGGGLLGMGAQKRENQRQRDWAQQQADTAWLRQQQSDTTAWNRTVDMWNANNRYNSFENQSRLMEEGGLNPAVMYGFQGGGSANLATSDSSPQANAGSAPQGDSPNTRAPGLQLASALQSAVPQMVQMMTAIEDLKQKSIDTEVKELDLLGYKYGFGTEDQPNGMPGYVAKNLQARGSVESTLQSISESRKRVEHFDEIIKTQVTIQALNAQLATTEGAKRNEIVKRIELLQKDIDNYIKNWAGPVGNVLNPILRAISGR
jgi:hypothetical protein